MDLCKSAPCLLAGAIIAGLGASHAFAEPVPGVSTIHHLIRQARGAGVARHLALDDQGRIVEHGEGAVAAPHDEMSAEERRRFFEVIEANRTRLIAEGKLSPVPQKVLGNFAWPLRQAAGRTDFDFFGITNYVDENLARPDKLLDYNCGDRTYDTPTYNHGGTDISIFPFPWRKMDNDDVVIVAGAPGTIIFKTDGNFDRSCAMSNAAANEVDIQHADGSVASYRHMKSGSPTSKVVGDTVVTGEYLGIVGSSGSSTGPHLHLEFYDASNNLVDPWLGACNSMSKAVTWAKQRPYRDPAVLALTVGTGVPDIPACPNPESSFATDYVTPGTAVYFTTYMRDQLAATPLYRRILRPDGSVYSTSTSAASTDYTLRYAYSFFNSFPNTPGTWTFEVTLAGKLYTKTFQVGGSASFGAPASIAASSGTPQTTAPNMPFAATLRARVLDASARPVKGAMVTFAAPTTGARAILESRTAITDASGYAAVSALANATAGAYSVTATVSGVATPASFSLQNIAASVVGVSAAPASVDFGGQSMNTTSASRTVTLTNTSGGALTVSSVTVPPPFVVTHNCAGLAAGASCVATLTFTPTLRGNVAGFLSVQTGAGMTRRVVAGTGEQSLVTHYYRSILRRDPDAGGKAFWEDESARVPGLGVNVNETWFAMAMQFYFSAEYLAFNRDNTGFVTDLYNTFFNRPPDSGGLGFWLANLNSGMPREVALAEFMFSTEFRNFAQAIFANTVARAEVDAVTDFYRGLLARLPDDGGFAFWVGKFRAAQCTQPASAAAAAITAQVEAISKAYADSYEYLGRTRTHAQYVGDLYNAFLRRGGDAAGVQFWIGRIASGALTRDAVRQQFRDSPEFQARVAAIIAQGCAGN